MIRFDRLIDFLYRTIIALFALGIVWLFRELNVVPLHLLWLTAGVIVGAYIAKLK